MIPYLYWTNIQEYRLADNIREIRRQALVVPIRVLIVDDHRMFREGVRTRLEHEPDIQVVGEACCVAEMMSQIKQTRPTILTLDIRMPDGSGIEAAEIVGRNWPDLKILMLTGYDYDQYVRVAIRLGIGGFLLKDAPQEELIAALQEIAAGGTFLPPNIASVMTTYPKSLVNRISGRWKGYDEGDRPS